ncbi:MAG: metallophosphoesterase family protein, partial [Candidatus Marinimicrobia bacterium]|nr:metallophosphoesterase family protein [Candidatus Neomarinimicrobiota bacterium]
MKLKQQIKFLFIILLVLTGCKEKSTHIGPWLQSPTKDGITILVGTKKEVKATLLLSANTSELTLAAKDSIKLRLHSYTLTDLEPDNKYYYQVRWQGGRTDTAYFEIAPASDTGNVRILAYGDSRSNPTVHEQIINKALEYNPDIALHTGDLVVNGKILSRWEPEFFAPAADLLQQIPIYPVLGNHERESGYYYEYFPLHKNKHYWSADYGMVHIIGLNTGVATDPESEQYQWLEADLKANIDQQWTIVLLHYPLFHVHPSRPVYDFRYHWQPLFEKYGVNLVFSGHDHYYLRNHPIGHGGSGQTPVTHITTAGGGAPLYKIEPQPFMAVSRSIHHFLMLEVSAEKITGEAVDLDGNTIDRFTILSTGELADDEKYIDFGIMELEQNLISQLGDLEIVEFADSLLQFSAECNFGSELTFDSDLHIKWQDSEYWQITNPDLEIEMQNGVDYQYEFQATVPAGSAMPGPVVLFTISPDSGSETDAKQATIPENLTFEVSLENAMYIFATAKIKSE